MDAIEQGPVLGGNAVDVVAHGVVHPSMIAQTGGRRGRGLAVRMLSAERWSWVPAQRAYDSTPGGPMVAASRPKRSTYPSCTCFHRSSGLHGALSPRR